MTALAIAPDGTWLATADDDRTARSWNEDGTPRATLLGHRGGMAVVAIAPDGTWLAIAGDNGTVRTWDADGKPCVILTGHRDPVTAVAIAPDRTWLATAGWDGADLGRRRQAPRHPHRPPGHSDRGGDRARRQLARHRRRRRDSSHLDT